MKAKTTEKPKENGRKAIIWGRYSSSKQDDSDSRSRQERLNRLLAKKEGIHVIAEYFDEASSVKSGVTTLFQKIVKTLPDGVGIICENLDRINRDHPWRQKAWILDNLLDKGHWIWTSEERNQRLYTADTIKQMDTLVVGDMATNVGYAENDKRIKRIREEKAKAIQLAREGKASPLGAWLPAHLRYNFETQQYDFNQSIADVIKRIFVEYKKGKGTSAIAKGLNADKIPTFGNKKVGGWNKGSIRVLLRYEGVIGTLIHQGERMENAFPPAISEDLFYDVQGKLNGNKRRRGNYEADRVNNIFRGLCECCYCHNAVKVYKHRYLGCSGYRDGQCNVKTLVPWRDYEYEFAEWLIPNARKLLLGEDESDIRIKTLEGKLNAIQGRIEATIDLLDAGVAVNEIKSRLAKLEGEKIEIENALTSAKAEASSKASYPATIKELSSLLEGIKDNQDIRKQVASLMPSVVSKVVVDIKDRNKVRIACKFADGSIGEWGQHTAFVRSIKRDKGMEHQGVISKEEFIKAMKSNSYGIDD